jgi:N-acyl-phosphatidylethanolamine-hydrolysing phospholipase D
LFQTPASPPLLAKQPKQENARLAVTWVGHATALVQLNDRFVLTDPVFTQFVGGVQRRLILPGLNVADLPQVAAVLISHGHFDHLSVGSLEQIAPKVEKIIMPSKVMRWVPDLGFERVELDNWQSTNSASLKITAVPVVHDGRRFGIGADVQDACAGYIIEYQGLTVYFGGDQAYSAEINAAVRARFPKIDLALLPIGPVEPAPSFRKTYLDPAQAVQMAADLKAIQWIPIHYGTFQMSHIDEPMVELSLLSEALKAEVGSFSEAVVLKIGETRTLIAK